MTTHEVELTIGSDTIDLTSDPYMLNNYIIRSARQRPNGGYDNVDERITFSATGTDAATTQAAWEAVGRFISVVQERKSIGEGQPLYLEIRPAGETIKWRSEIISATIVPEDRTLELWSNFCIVGHIEFRREPFFWGHEQAVPLTNRNGTDSIVWLPIDNKEDATSHAHVDIKAEDIEGEIPTPLNIWLENNDGTNRDYREFFIGVNARSDPMNIIPVFEAEDMDGISPAITPLAACSNGQYATVTKTGGNQKLYARWLIPEATTDAFAGRFARVLVKTMSLSQDWVLQAQILDMYNLVTLYEGRPRTVTTDNRIVDLGTVPIPPIAYTNFLAQMTLRIAMYHLGGDGDEETISLDYVFLMPTDAGRSIKQRGMLIPDDEDVLFDEIEGYWVSNESGRKHPIYSPRGPGVMAFPGVDQRVFIFHDRSNNQDQADAKSIRAFYRRRRLTF